MSYPVWNTIEMRLVKLFSLPHNALELKRKGCSPELAAKKKMEEIRSGLSGVPKEEEFVGPRLFLRWLAHPISRIRGMVVG